MKLTLIYFIKFPPDRRFKLIINNSIKFTLIYYTVNVLTVKKCNKIGNKNYISNKNLDFYHFSWYFGTHLDKKK